VACCAELSIDEKPMFDFALKLHEQLDTENQCLHVYKLPLAYFPYMEQNDQALEDATQKRAQERFKSFKKQAKLDGELWELVLRKGVQIADTVAIYAKEQALDLVIITRSGKNTPATYRVGSNAKKLMRTSIGIPMLIL
jgi:nucleotide-binding universal stress UspA family protein